MAELKVDRNVITLSYLGDRSDDEYWHSKSPMERLAAIQTRGVVVSSDLKIARFLPKLKLLFGLNTSQKGNATERVT